MEKRVKYLGALLAICSFIANAEEMNDPLATKQYGFGGSVNWYTTESKTAGQTTETYNAFSFNAGVAKLFNEGMFEAGPSISYAHSKMRGLTNNTLSGGFYADMNFLVCDKLYVGPGLSTGLSWNVYASRTYTSYYGQASGFAKYIFLENVAATARLAYKYDESIDAGTTTSENGIRFFAGLSVYM